MVAKGKGNRVISHHEPHSPDQPNTMMSGTQPNRKRKRVNQITVSSSSAEKSNTKFAEEGDSFSSTQNGRQQNYERDMSEVEQLRHYMENMATLMVKYIPITNSQHASDGSSFVKSNEAGPIIYALTNGRETEEIMSRLGHTSERQLEDGRIIKEKGNTNKEGGSLKGEKLCKQGTKKGGTIPRWMPVGFIPPSSMLIDEIHAKIAAYIFTANNVRYLTGDEVLIKSQRMVG